MRIFILSAALALSTGALAQETVPPPPPPGDGVTQEGTDPQGTAVPPPGTNQPPMEVPAGTPVPDQSAAFTPQPAPASYPPCSRTITDRCVQTHERGRRR